MHAKQIPPFAYSGFMITVPKTFISYGVPGFEHGAYLLLWMNGTNSAEDTDSAFPCQMWDLEKSLSARNSGIRDP